MKKITKKIMNGIGSNDDNPIITSPMADKLSGVIDMPDEKLHGLIYSIVLGWLEEHELGIVKASGSSKYPLAVKVYYPGADGIIHLKSPFMLLQFTSKKASKRQIRFEYNPAYMTAKGEEHLDGMFWQLFGIDTGFYDVLTHARFTRVDFCMDILFRNLEDYLFRSQHSKISNSWMEFTTTGILDTITFGKPGNNQVIIYNKAKQVHGNAAEYGTIRIEVRRRTNLTIKQLAAFPNPFERIKVYSLRCKKPPFGEAHWRAFQDSCRLRGVNNAIKHQPIKCRSILKKALSSQCVAWWGDAIKDWDDLLTDALDKAGLLNIPDHAPSLTIVNAAGYAA